MAGRTGCPDDLPRVGVDQLGNLTARIFHRLFGFPAEGVGARSRVTKIAFIGEAFDHLGSDTRIHRGSGGIVEVNRQFHSDISYQAVALLIRWRTLLSCPFAATSPRPCAYPGAERPAARPGD